MKLKVILLLSFAWLLVSCGGSKKHISKAKQKIPKTTQQAPSQNPHTTPPETVDTEEADKRIEALPNPLEIKPSGGGDAASQYISLYKEVAMEEMGTFGIPASITLAQGLLESGNGNSDLTRRSNNHFGIKCHEWTGDRVYHDDDARQECFRKYENPNYSYRDHSLFLRNRARYSSLFNLPIEDYKAWARGLKAAGYATDPRYPVKLIGLIDKYSLYQYDQEALSRYPELSKKRLAKEPPAKATSESSYIVKKGDTLYNIAQRFGVSVEALKRQNNLRSNTISIGQRLRVRN